jgi:hypothetical protein
VPAGDAETVVVLRPPGKDRFGDPAAGDTAQFDLPGCLFAPGPSIERNTAANQVDSDATVYAPAGSDVRAADRLRVRGVVYDVIGNPQDWGRAGVVIALRLVTG